MTSSAGDRGDFSASNLPANIATNEGVYNDEVAAENFDKIISKNQKEKRIKSVSTSWTNMLVCYKTSI